MDQIEEYIAANVPPNVEWSADTVYAERNMLLAALAKMCAREEWEFGMGIEMVGAWRNTDPEESEDWENVIFIELGYGQMSWHVHTSAMFMFEDLPVRGHTEETGYYAWDGHDNIKKYTRLLKGVI